MENCDDMKNNGNYFLMDLTVMELAEKVHYVPLKTYKGTCLFEYCEVEKIQQMEVYDDDTWVLSYPRSGTTITQEIVYLLHSGQDFKTAQTIPLDNRFPFLDLYLPEVPNFRGLRGVESQQRPRLIKSHLHHHVLPEKLFTSNCKKIYIYRNPKDVVVSNFMLTQFLKQYETEVTMDAFLDDWLAGKTYNTPWWLHVHDFWVNRNKISNLLVLKYEDMVKDMKSVIGKIATHLGIPVTAEDTDKIADFCSFDQMKARKSTNALWFGGNWKVDKTFGGHIRKGKIGGWKERFPFSKYNEYYLLQRRLMIRKRGKTGGWKDHFTPKMSEKIDMMVKDRLGHLDISFEYGV